MKVIIIGRGGSCLRCTRQFVESHDIVVTANRFVYKGYEQYVGNRSDIQFRNRVSYRYTPDDIKTLGLKKVVYSNMNGCKGVPVYYENYGVEVICPKPPIKKVMCQEENINFSTGVIAMYYMLENYPLTEMSVVGMDLYEKGFPLYYFGMNDVAPALKKIYRRGFTDNVVNVTNHHDADKTAKYIQKLILSYPDVRFNILTNSSRFVGFATDNVKFM